MAKNTETRVEKSATFEQWRKSTNKTSFDTGPIASNNKANALSVERALDIDGRFGDQIKTFTAAAGDYLYRDLSLRLEYLPGESIDNTGGYIIFRNLTAVPATIVPGAFLTQQDGQSNITFSCLVVSISTTKALVSSTKGTFDPSIAIALSSSVSTNIAASNLARLIIGSSSFTSARIYRQASNNTYLNGGSSLPQNYTSALGYHIPNITTQLNFISSAPAIPISYTEGETIYQTANEAVTSASNATTFSAKIRFISASQVQGLGAYGGILLYDVVGTLNSSLKLISTTDGVAATGTIAATHIPANGALIAATNNEFGTIVEFNQPLTVGDIVSIQYTNLVDAALELQDDIGTIEDLGTNTVQAGFGSTTRKSLTTTDLVTTLNTLQDMIGSATLPTITNNTHLVPANVITISNATKSIMDFIGDTDLSDAALGATTDAQSTLTAAITSIKSFIGSTDISGVTTGEKITDSIARLHTEIGDVTQANLGTDVGSHTDITSKISAIDTHLGNSALTSNNNVTLLASQTVSDTLQKLMTVIGETVQWKTIPNTTQSTDGNAHADTTITLSAANPAIKAGQLVSGTNVGSTRTVVSINGTALVLSSNPSGTIAADTVLTFSNIVAPTLVDVLDFIHDEMGDVKALSAANLGNVADKPRDISTAINAIKSFIGVADISDIDNGTDNTITSALDQIYTDIGDVGASGANLTGSVFNSTTTDLQKAILALGVAATGAVELDTAFHASNSGSLAHAAGYSATNLHQGITEIQGVLGDVTSLSNDADSPAIKSVNHVTTAASAANTSITVNTTPASAVNSGTYTLVDVGYLVTLVTDAAGNDAVVPADTVVIKKNANGNLILNNAVTLSIGDTLKLSEPANSYGFNDDNIVSALLELKAALVGGTADLSDKIATLDDSDGAATDFDSGNIVDAIREIQDDLGQRSLISSSINVANAGTFNSDTYTDAINSILTVIGSENISGIHGSTHTLSHTIKKLHDELGNVTAVAMGTTASTVVTAIKELHDEIGSANISTVSGTDDSITTAINQLHHEIGDVAGSNTRLGVQSDRLVATSSSVASPNSGVILNLVNTLKLVPGMRVYGTGITTGATIVSVDSNNNRVTLSAGGITTSITTGSPVNITFKAETLQVKALALDTNTGDVGTIADATGYVATNLVGGLTEIQGKIGEVTAANMGTTASTAVTAINELATTKLAIGGSAAAMKTAMGTNSSTVTAAIKEIIDGTSQGDTTLRTTAADSTQRTIVRDAQNGGFLRKVKDGLIGSTAQKIISNIDFSPANANVDSQTTFKFNTNTVLDVSDATFIVASATTDYSITGKAIKLVESTSSVQGLIINRAQITNHIIPATPEVSLQWDEGKMSGKYLGWQIAGIGQTIANAAADPAVQSAYNAGVVDFFNAKHLVKGATLQAASNSASNTGLTITWSETDQSFVYAVTRGAVALTGDVTGSATMGDDGAVSISTTIAANSVALGTDTTGNYVKTIAETSGTSNFVFANGSTEGGDATFKLADDIAIDGKLHVKGTGGDVDSSALFDGNVKIVGALSVTGNTLALTASSAAISAESFVLNNADDSASKGLFINHRGFKAANTLSNALIIGQRYKFVAAGTGSPDWRTVGASAATPTAGEIFIATAVQLTNTAGDADIDDGTAKQQELQSAIEWDETSKEWRLYRPGRSANSTVTPVIAQGDTISNTTSFTSTEDDTSTSLRLLMHGNATASGDESSWPASDYVGALKSDNALKYNSATNLFSIVAGRISADDGESTFGDILADNARAASSGNITSKGLTKSLGGMLIENASPFIKFNETGLQVDVSGTLTDSPVEWWTGGDGGNFSVRMNNLSNYPFEIQTTNALNSVTKAVKDIYLRPGVGGNLNVQGPINNIGLMTNRLNSSTTPLSKTAGTRLTQANFTGLVGENAGNQSSLHIQDVRITTVDAGVNRTATTASKRIAHAIDGDGYSFIDFQGTSSIDNEIRLGGYRSAVVKTFLKGNVSGPTELYNNEANDNASLLRLSTKSSGVRYYGAILRNRDLPTVGYTGNDVTSPFESTVPIADVKGNTVTYSTHTVVDGSHVLIDPAPALPAAGTSATQFVIRGGANGSGGYSAPFARTTGLSLKMSSENTAGESGKGYDIYSQSTQAYANNPDLYFARSDGLLRQLIQNNGDIAFYKGNTLGSQTKGLLWDASEGRLGIGTETPEGDLHISAGNGANGNCTLILSADIDNNSSHEASVPIIELRSDALLNQGKMYLSGNGLVNGLLANSMVMGAYGNSDEASAVTRAANHAIQFATGGRSSGQTGGLTEPTARMTIVQDGNVGIGTNAPTAKLHVDGTVTTGALTTTGDVTIGQYDTASSLYVGTINAADTNDVGNPQQLILNAGESFQFATGQTAESVYINAESGLQVNSHPKNWGDADGATAGWAGKNPTVSINKADGSSEFNQIKHTGLTMTSGSDIDQLYTLGPVTIGATDYNSDWVDTTINGTDLTSGSYMVQLYVNEGGDGVFQEYYTGVMSWFSGDPNSTESDEIVLHNAGQASLENDSTRRGWFLRTTRTLSADTDNVKLQIRSQHNAVDGGTYTIKLRRML
jgi:hypothetical protein